MGISQKRTFLVYSRGLSDDDMSLGSLYLDPANPLDIEQKRFELPHKLADIKEWLRQPQRDEPCELHFSASSDWLISAGLVEIIHIKTGRTGSRDVTISAKVGIRYLIKKPEDFLNEVVLKNPAAEAWLADKLTLSRADYYSRKVQFGGRRSPRIWMLTGIQLLINADVKSGDGKSSVKGGGVSVPPPEPVAAAVAILTGTSLASAEVESNHKFESKALYGHQDARIWAAQFAPLDVKYIPLSRGDETPKLGRILLHPFPDLGDSGARNHEGETDERQKPGDEVADVVGLGDESTQGWDDSPALLIKALQEDSWDALLDEWSFGDSEARDEGSGDEESETA